MINYIDVCQSGCRMDAHASTGRMDGKDPLMQSKEHILEPFKFKEHTMTVISQTRKWCKYFSSQYETRFREEDGFWLMNIRWANTIEISNEEAKFFIEKQKTGEKSHLQRLSL